MGEHMTYAYNDSGEHVAVDVHWPGHGPVDLRLSAPRDKVSEDELTVVNHAVSAHVREMLRDSSVLEARVPDLDPWAGVGVLALHSHTAEEDCDERCSIYTR